MGEVGEVQWFTFPTSAVSQTVCEVSSSISSDSPFADFIIDQGRPIETLLYRTASGVGTTSFQLVTPEDDGPLHASDSNHCNEASNNQYSQNVLPKKRPREEISTLPESAYNNLPPLEICPKFNPCKSRTQTWNCDLLRISATALPNRSTLLIFSQPRQEPTDRLSVMYQRGRFGAR